MYNLSSVSGFFDQENPSPQTLHPEREQEAVATLSLSLTHTHTHPLSLPLSPTHTHTLSLSISVVGFRACCRVTDSGLVGWEELPTVGRRGLGGVL